MSEPISRDDTALLRAGTCPDCQGAVVATPMAGMGACYSKNLLCTHCNMLWNVPNRPGPGERYGRQGPPPEPIPLHIPGQGSIVQGRGRFTIVEPG